MVTKEQAVAQQKKQLSANQEAKAKQDAIISASKQNRDQNRGYQSESTDRFGNTEVYREPSKTASQDPRALQDNRKAIQAQDDNRKALEAKQDQTKQLQKEVSNLSPQNQTAYRKFLEATAKAGDQKSIDELRKQGTDVYTIKQGPYERTYFKSINDPNQSDSPIPDDVYKELTTGYKDEKGNIQQNYFINPIKSGAGVRDEISFESEFQKTNIENQKNTDEFLNKGRDLGFKQVRLTINGKSEIVEFDDPRLYDFTQSRELSFVKTPEMIDSYKQYRENLKNTLIQFKDLGGKEIKIKRGDTFEKFPIDRAYFELTKGFDSFSFVQSPQMRKEKLKELESRRDFGNYAKNIGATEIKRVDNGIVSKFPVSDYNKAFKGANELSTFGIVVNENVRKQNSENLELKREFIQEGFGVSGREYSGIRIGKDKILLTTPKEVSKKLNELQLKNPGIAPVLLRSQEQKKIDRTQYEDFKKGYAEIQKSGAEYVIVGKEIEPIDRGFRKALQSQGTVSPVYKFEEPYVPQDPWSQSLMQLNKDPYAPPDIVPVKNIENIPENKIYHERKTDIPFDQKIKHNVNVFYANTFGMITGAYNQALPGYDKLVNKLTGNYDKNKISFEPLPVAPARLLYVPESVVGAQTSAIAVSALEAKDFEDFINKTGVRQQDVYQMLSDQPIERTLGQIGGFIAPFFVTKGTLRLIPLRYTKTPISTVVSPYGADYYSKSLRLGYDRFNILLGQKYGITGKISIGKARPELSGVSLIKGTESKSSFDTYQVGSFTKTQRQDFDPAFKYLEKIGIEGQGDISKVDPLPNLLKITEKNRSIIDIITKRNIQPKEVTQTFGRIEDPITKQITFEERLDPEKTIDFISKLQKKKMISEREGSPAFNLYKTQPQRIIGDWDFSLLKDKALVFKTILESNIVKPGYTLFAKGSKIVTGVKDSPFWLGTFSIPSGKVVSGISSKTGQKVLKEGVNIDDTPRGFYFSTPNMKLASDYVRKKSDGILLEHEWDMKKILRFKDVPKHLRKKLLAYDIDDRIERFYKSQERIKEYAQSLKKGYLGATRPYEPGSKFFEIYAWDAKAIKSTKKLEPSGYTIKKGTEREFLNLLDDEDQAKSIVKGLSDKFFGDKFKTKTVKQTAPSGSTITTHDLFAQMKKLSLANSQILDEGALLNYRGDATKFKGLFEKARIRVGFGTLGRLGKDTASNYYFGMRLMAEAASKSGNRPLAEQWGKVMNMEFHKQKAWGFDWQNEIAKIKESPVTIVKGKKDYGISEKISSGAKSTFAKSPLITGYSEQYKAPSESMTSKFSTKSQKSIASIKPSSLSMKSASMKVASMKSASIKSASMKSGSTKSPSIASMKSVSSSIKSVSPKSFSMKSPSIKSVVSPKIPSSKSPSIKSPSLKSPSLGSPSIKSPSLKSPSLGSPSLKSPSIKSPSLSFPILKTPPTRTLLLPGIMKFGKHKKSYSDLPKYSLTFKWSVKNPVFKKFSINEGKRKKIEW